MIDKNSQNLRSFICNYWFNFV